MTSSSRSTRRACRLGAFLLAVAFAVSCGSPNKPGPIDTTVSVTSVSPASVTTGGGTTITVTGTNFASDAKIFIDNVALTNITVTGTTSITGTTPVHTAGAASLSVTTGGKTATFTGAFSYVAPSGANTPPVVTQIRTIGPRPNQPQTFADLGDSIAVIATVTDKETPISQLTYAWTATTGTITGTGSTVTWVAPATLATSPATVALQVTVTETFTENAIVHRQTTTSAIAMYVHDSNKELLDMGEDFLRLFSLQVPPVQVLHNFSQTCNGGSGYQSELNDTIHNQATFTQLPTWVITKMPPVTLNFGGSCALPGRGPISGDACARLHAHWDAQNKSTGEIEHTNGVDEITAALEDNQWRICDSSFVSDSAFPPALEHQIMFDVRTKIIKRY